LTLLALQVGIEALDTFGANTMTKSGAGMSMDICFDLTPVPFVVSDFFA